MRRRLTHHASAIVLAALLLASAAEAAPVRIQAAEGTDRARIVFQWEQARTAAPEIAPVLADGVLTIRFADQVEINVEAIVQGLPAFVSSARLGSDGRSLTLALTRPVTIKSSRSYELSALDLVADGAPPPDPIRSTQADIEDKKAAEAAGAKAAQREAARPKPVGIEVTAGEIEGLTRITLDWPSVVNFTESRDGARLTLRFARPALADLAPIRIDPPKRLARISGANDDDRFTLVVETAPDVTIKVFRDAKQVVIDLRDAPPPTVTPAEAKAGPPKGILPPGPVALAVPAADAPVKPAADPFATDNGDDPGVAAPPRPDPVPKSGVVRVRASPAPGGITIDTEWAAPAPAAAFRRGDSVFILFGAEARLDFSAASLLRRPDSGFTEIRGAGLVGFALKARPDQYLSAKAEGAKWRFSLSDRNIAPPQPALARREPGPDGRARLRVLLPGIERVGWINDPFVGDRLAVAMAHGPERGVLAQRSILEARLLPTAQGAAAEVLGQGVIAEAAPSGFVLASGDSTTLGDLAFVGGSGFSGQSATPAFIDFDNWKGGKDFTDTLRRLGRDAARADPGTPQARDAHLAMARFYLAHEMGPEALGALNVAGSSDPNLAGDRHFLGLRGVANYMTGRLKPARRDLGAGPLADDPNAALWRALASADEGDWPQARRQLQIAGDAFESYGPLWRAIFRTVAAQAAIEAGDPQNARTLALAALQDAGTIGQKDPRIRPALIVKARADAETGALDAGLKALDALAGDPDERIAVLAELSRVDLGLKAGRIKPEEAVDRMEALRYRWRGDAIELAAIEYLGTSYIQDNRWREAFNVMQGAAARGGDLPGARRLRAALADGFRALFIEGAADQLEPIEALGLFYQFRELAPQGPEGDEGVRKLARRLVSFDLLPQAAELLQHQVDRRLRGEDEARVAADLAGIYLIAREPEKALRALRETRQPRLPEPLRRERRVLESAALAGLKRYDHAMELLEGVEGDEAARLRADVAWRQQEWGVASTALQKLLPAANSPLDREGQALALRATVAASLAEDKAAIAKLARDHGLALGTGPYAEAFAVLTREPERSGESLREAARRIADTAAFDGFLAALRRKFVPPQA